MTQLGRFVTEGNEKADELAKQKQCWTKDLWQKRVQKLSSRRERDRGGVCSFAVCGQLPLFGGGMEKL